MAAVQTPQEALIQIMAGHVVGSPFVFAPDVYRKGRGVREPCDVAWVSNDVAVLINATTGGRSHADQDRHNYKQLLGWMQAWNADVPLRGRNSKHTFSIVPDDIRHVVLVSIVAGPEPAIRRRDDVVEQARNKRVVMYVTMTTRFLSEFVARAGSIVDLCRVCAFLPPGTPVSEAEAIDWLDRMFRWHLQLAGSWLRAGDASLPIEDRVLPGQRVQALNYCVAASRPTRSSSQPPAAFQS